jgi:hypothetical protein
VEVSRVARWSPRPRTGGSLPYEIVKTFQLTDLNQVGTWHRYSTGN